MDVLLIPTEEIAQGRKGSAALLTLSCYEERRSDVFRPAFATYFRCLIPLCGNMQGGGVPHVDGHGMLCNVMHHDNRWQTLIGFPTRDRILNVQTIYQVKYNYCCFHPYLLASLFRRSR